MRTIIKSILLFSLAASALSAQENAHGSHRPAPAARVEPTAIPEIRSLDIAVSGQTLHLLLGEFRPAESRTSLWHRRSDDGGLSWSPPARVDTGGPAPYGRGRGTDFQIVAVGENLTTVWLTDGPSRTKRGPLVCARSTDGGRTWQPAATPANDGTDCDHAFIDLAATPDGAIHALWLDARSGEGKGLISARSRDFGATWSTNRIVDPKTCECCWNILQADQAGVLYGFYRDIDPRDMTVALSGDGGTTWRSLPPGGAFHWDFKGCPHVGGALAVQGSGATARLHTLVWTGVAGRSGLHYLTTSAPDFAWSAPVRIGSDRARYSDIAVTPSGVVAAAWIETTPEGETILRYQLSRDGGNHWLFAVAVPSAKNGPTHPRLAVIGERFHLFWSATQAPDWHHITLIGESTALP
ncbi:MAG: exo-alpha-sialidase [Verrucomicrobia bacterium]|nr:exo-alpha-sialidase [Verrucomicrobiota bacterium]